MSSTKRYSKRFFTGLVLLTIVGVIALFGIMHFYGDEVKQSILDQLNQRMNVELSVEEIQLDLFTNFPKASLRFRNVNSTEKQSSAGKSLLKASEISLVFNMQDIFYGKYKIEKINLHDAFLNLHVQENGDVNYKILDRDESASEGILIDLRRANFKNVVISFIHTPSQQEYLFRIDEGSLHGAFSRNLQQIEFNGSIYSTHIKSGKNTFLKDRQLILDTEIGINNESHTIEFKKGDLHADGINFGVTGNVVTQEANKNLNLLIIVAESSLQSLTKLIPSNYLEPMSKLTMEGKTSISALISGNFSGNNIPQIDVDFTLKGGQASHKESKLKLSDVQFSGKFTNGKSKSERSYHLKLKDIKSVIQGGHIEGSIEISNFTNPRIHTRILSSLNLEYLPGYFPLDTLESLSGTLKLDMEFTNTLKGFRGFTIQDFISSKTSGSMEIEHTNFRLTGSIHKFQDFNGTFRFNNKDLEIKQFTGYISDSDFQMKGYFRNVLAYVFVPGESMFIDAEFKSNKINLDEILNTGKEKAYEKNKLVFSGGIQYNLDFEVDTFTFRKFRSTDNSGQIIQENKILYVKNAQFNSMDGMVNISGMINGQSDQMYYIQCKAGFDKVNIRKLFSDFGNFGQTNLTSSHLRGTVDASVEYASTLTPYLHVAQKSVYTLADLQIYNGELINYQPLNKLSRYVREGEIEHVRFSTLKNKVKIENEVVYIPQMDIESSSMNLTLFGKHTFSNHIDYHVQLLLSQIIARNDNIKEDLGDNFVVDDGLGKTRLYLSMTGLADDPVIKYDTREVRNKISEDLKEEKKDLRNAFRKEFGLNNQTKNPNNDSVLLEQGQNKDFHIEFEEHKKAGKKESKSNKKVSTEEKKENSNQEDFIIIWDEENDTINKPQWR